MQHEIRERPAYGFWLVSFASYVCAPFLTNDGVCLLFVEPIMAAFAGVSAGSPASRDKTCPATGARNIGLHRSDALYFLLGLACASDCGSILTYTGNPQVHAWRRSTQYGSTILVACLVNY